MARSVDPLTLKEEFLQGNQLFSEMELTDECKPVGKLHAIDLQENEIWLLQCPKGVNITELENQKLKMPGRTNIGKKEAVSMEFNECIRKHAFAYYNRKGGFSLRLLPVQGTIILRDRLKAAENVTAERAEECWTPSKRAPLPSSIRVRHPLLGAQYEDKLELDKSTVKRLQNADEISTLVLKQYLNKKNKTPKKSTSEKKLVNQVNTTAYIEIESEDSKDASEGNLSRKKHKNNHSESNTEENSYEVQCSNKKKKRKNYVENEEVVSKDLQWLRNI